MTDSGYPDVLSCSGVTFDRRQRTLLVHGNKVLLDSRSALVFQTLAEHFGELVSKDELLETAWPGRVVHENSLAKAISRLRGAITGSGLEITATYGFGYSLRHVGDHLSQDTASEQPQEGTLSTKPSNPAHWGWKAGATGALLIAVAAAFVLLDRPGTDVGIRNTAPVTNDAADARATILWVDDNPSNNRLEVEFFRSRKLAVHLAESTDQALKLIGMNRYKLVLSDLGRGENRLAGLDLSTAIRKQDRRLPVIIYTIRPSTRDGQEAQKRMVAEAGASDLAVTPAEVRAKVMRLIETLPASTPR